jgi:hypothetical protein
MNVSVGVCYFIKIRYSTCLETDESMSHSNIVFL